LNLQKNLFRCVSDVSGIIDEFRNLGPATPKPVDQ
jgi:hypothetical protein